VIKAKTLQDLFKRYRRPGDLVFAIVFLVFSIAMAASLGSQVKWTSSKIFSEPAFWPYVSVICMLVFSALHLVSSLASPVIAGRWREVGFWIRSVEFAVWFMVYVLMVPRLGYLPSTIIFALALTSRLGYRQAKYLGAATLFAIGVVLVFKTFLQVKVPGGQIYEYLPTAARSFMLTYF
jgi:hypothetical protein